MSVVIYDSSDRLVGTVSGDNIYDSSDRLVGRVSGDNIYDSNDLPVAMMHGDKILSMEFDSRGSVRGSEIYEGAGEGRLVGRVSPAPTSEKSLNAAGGAAELLLFSGRSRKREFFSY